MGIRKKFLNVKYFLRLIMYILFMYTTKTIVNSSSVSPIFLWGIAIFVLCFDIFYSYLKYQIELIMILLAEAEETEIIIIKLNKVKKLDILKGLHNSLIIPEILLAFDCNKPEEVLNLTHKHEKFLRSKLDYLLIYRYSNFKAYALLGEYNLAKEAYGELFKLKDLNIKNKEMKLLYNWEQIEALHQYILSNNSFSLKLYKQINISRYNQREKLHYYYEIYLLANTLKDIKTINYAENEMTKINPRTRLLSDG